MLEHLRTNACHDNDEHLCQCIYTILCAVRATTKTEGTPRRHYMRVCTRTLYPTAGCYCRFVLNAANTFHTYLFYIRMRPFHSLALVRVYCLESADDVSGAAYPLFSGTQITAKALCEIIIIHCVCEKYVFSSRAFRTYGTSGRATEQSRVPLPLPVP